MREVIRLAGIVLMVATLPLLMIGQTAADCLVIAVVGYGMSRWLV